MKERIDYWDYKKMDDRHIIYDFNDIYNSGIFGERIT